jgi:tRNA threonylcarbamoyladenosine biosynthesis protein TsaE
MSPSETVRIGEEMGRVARPGTIYALYGELGSGKTEFVKGIAKGLGVEEWEYVCSPTFTIMNVYEGRMRLCHVDLFRIRGEEVGALAIEEYLDDGVVCVEWAEKGRFEGAVKVYIDVLSETQRRFLIVEP